MRIALSTLIQGYLHRKPAGLSQVRRVRVCVCTKLSPEGNNFPLHNTSPLVSVFHRLLYPLRVSHYLPIAARTHIIETSLLPFEVAKHAAPPGTAYLSLKRG